ncbi:MAG: hypothetical protein IH944_05885 [Armatimonadetes bacterium]|nr:hypothetical protein [Armatimonadota bacterium]
MKALAITIPILLVGAALGAAYMGYLPFFGSDDKSATIESPASPARAEQTATTQAEPAAPVPVNPTPDPPQDQGDTADVKLDEIDPDQGAHAVAKIWNEIDARELAGIIVVWQDNDLALILSHMERRTVAEVLSLLGPERAVQLSEQIKALASVVPEDETE